VDEPDKSGGVLKFRKTPGDILIESGLIVFSILVALAVNEYASSRADAARVKRALAAITVEVRANRDRLALLRPYQLQITEEAQAADSAGRTATFAMWRAAVPSFKGFHNPELDATAWQTALTTGVAAHIGIDTIATLSRVYNYQAKLDAYYASAIPGFDFSDASMRATARKAYIFLATVITNQDSLASQYAAALRVLGSRDASDRP
jgi:hypothetical protein